MAVYGNVIGKILPKSRQVQELLFATVWQKKLPSVARRVNGLLT